jgi:hypothetical protein
MDRKSLIYFGLILFGAVFILWHFKKNGVMVASVKTGDTVPVDVAPQNVDDFSGSVNQNAPATQTYNAPTRINGADPSTQAYLSKSQVQLVLLPSALQMESNAASTGLTE